MIRKLGLLMVLGAAVSGCAGHSVDCGLGLSHTACRPGTAGYKDPSAFAAADDQQCRSFGMLPNTKQYQDCRADLSKQHRTDAVP